MKTSHRLQIKGTVRQRDKSTRATGKTAPKEYNCSPDITRRGAQNNPITSSHDYDNLIVLYCCTLLRVSDLYCLNYNPKNKIVQLYFL